MSIGVASAIARAKPDGRPGKLDTFGFNFKVRIFVDNDEVKPFRTISGKVVIENEFPIEHTGLFLRLEGVCTLRYSTKFDNRTTFHSTRKLILGSAKEDNLQESPQIGCTILKLLPSEEPYSIKPGVTTYLFSFQIPGNPCAPAAFKMSLGNLVYRLALYMRSAESPSYTPVEVGELPMKFSGHLNLSDNVDALKPVMMEKSYKKSLFKRRNLVETILSLETAGFLSGESVPFVLNVKNPTLIPLQMEVELVHQRQVCARGTNDSKKSLKMVISKKEKNLFEPESELTWIESLACGENQEPTYTLQSIYNVTYCLRYRIKILDHGSIKGEVPITIGTTRDSTEVLKSFPNNSRMEVGHFPGFSSRHRSASVQSVRSMASTSTTFTLPPAYSQLSSRRPSLETLPPTYDEVEGTWQVHRSPSPPPEPEETSDDDGKE